MVLSRSDYNVSNLYKGNWNPMNPRSLLSKAAGTFVAATVAVFVLALAVRKGVPLMNQLVGMVPGIGGNLQTGDDVRVF